MGHLLNALKRTGEEKIHKGLQQIISLYRRWTKEEPTQSHEGQMQEKGGYMGAKESRSNVTVVRSMLVLWHQTK